MGGRAVGLDDWPDRARARDETVVVSDDHTLGGAPRFRGTRVHVDTLFVNLAGGRTLDEILRAFPTLDRDDCVAALWQGMRALQGRALGERMLRERAARGDPAAAVALLDRLESHPTEPWDELPDGPMTNAEIEEFVADVRAAEPGPESDYGPGDGEDGHGPILPARPGRG